VRRNVVEEQYPGYAAACQKWREEQPEWQRDQREGVDDQESRRIARWSAIRPPSADAQEVGSCQHVKNPLIDAAGARSRAV
jgi:hypothetical protein